MWVLAIYRWFCTLEDFYVDGGWSPDQVLDAGSRILGQ